MAAGIGVFCIIIGLIVGAELANSALQDNENLQITDLQSKLAYKQGQLSYYVNLTTDLYQTR